MIKNIQSFGDYETTELDAVPTQSSQIESLDFRVATQKIQRILMDEVGIELAREEVGQAIKELLSDLIRREVQKQKMKKAFEDLKEKNRQAPAEEKKEEQDDYWCTLSEYYGE